MGDTKIQWTDMVWNPVTGCSKVSTGCKHCYAERLFPRVYGRDIVPIENPAVALANEETDRPREFTDVWLHPDRLEQPMHWKKPRMIFVNSMSDLFHEDVPFDFIEKIFDTMFLANQHTYQILTKRLKRALEFFESHTGIAGNMTKPFLSHVWFGCSIENQETADERIPILLQVPAAVRFLSCEPLLDEMVLPKQYLGEERSVFCEGCTSTPVRGQPTCPGHDGGGIDWVIVGGESGPGYRPMNLDWARSIRDQCASAGVPFFFKQTAGKKEIPEDLMIREYPNGQT